MVEPSGEVASPPLAASNFFHDDGLGERGSPHRERPRRPIIRNVQPSGNGKRSPKCSYPPAGRSVQWAIGGSFCVRHLSGKEIAVGKNSNGLGIRTLVQGPRGLIAGLLIGVGLSFAMRAGAQQQQPPAQPPPATSPRYQISVADPQKVFVLDHQSNMIYVFSTNNLGTWEAGEGFAITPELDRFRQRNPIPKVNP
jgi:hypothetical protein